METTLLSALSPQLQALVEASLGEELPNTMKGAISANDKPTGVAEKAVEVTKQQVEERSERALDITSRSAQLNPSELFVLKHPDSPGFVVKEGFLGRQNALAVRDALVNVAKSNEFHDAKVGAGGNSRNDRAVRGDRIHWIKTPRDPQAPSEGDVTSPAILHLRKQVESLVFGLKKVSPELDVRNVISTQFAIFPGDGARFVKHLDTYSNAQRDEHGAMSEDGLVRLVTCVYYLNDDWEPEDGGQLRVHLKETANLPACQWDVPPSLDTLVIFRSLDVEHEVLPTYTERKAVTIWFYGKPQRTRGTSPEVSRPVNYAPPPLPSVTGNQAELAATATIFVAIPSYRDPECRHTVDDLLARATFPDRISLGICLQADEHDDTRSYLESKYSSSKVRIHFVDYRKAAGPCVARAQAQKLWQGEEYYLQIDSHMRFRPGWDCFLIAELEFCSSSKAILTTYPLGYTLPNKVSSECRPTLLCASSFDSAGMLRQTGKILAQNSTKPPESLFWAGGFSFSSSRVITEVPYDETLRFLFFGEEASMAARLWTSGWDFFAPTEAVVYHLWTRAYRPVFQELESEETTQYRAASAQFVRKLLSLDDDTKGENNGGLIAGKYQLGSERSFEDYQKHLGVHFSSRDVEWRAQWGNVDPIQFDLSANSGANSVEPA